jgi:circadian clock protein KaiC
MASVTDPIPLDRLATGIPGFDQIAGGGLPVGRNTLVTGIAGAGKTVFAVQFLAEGIRSFGHPGVFVTLAETPADIRRNAAALGFDVAGWEREGAWRFVDASPVEEDVVVGAFDFSGLTARILAAVDAVGATRVSIDSVSTAFLRYADAAAVRTALQGMLGALKQVGVTAVLTAEGGEHTEAGVHLHIGEHATDGIVRLEYRLVAERRRRTIEVVKLRGGPHRSGSYPFSVRPTGGITAIPLGGVELDQEIADERVSTGDPVLDEMCGGGYFRDSVVLVAGATGTGKSLLATTFLVEGLARGERALFVGFEESAGQVRRNMRNWDQDVDDALADGRLQIVSRYPESAAIEDHLADIIARLDQLRPQRVVVDSLTALERIADDQPFREFVMGLTGFVKERRISGLYTAATTLLGGGHPTEVQASVLSDCIILLRYVEAGGALERTITVLKMRGSGHDLRMRGYTIDHEGLRIAEPLGGPTLDPAADRTDGPSLDLPAASP